MTLDEAAPDRGPTEADPMVTILERIAHVVDELTAIHLLCDQLLARGATTKADVVAADL